MRNLEHPNTEVFEQWFQKQQEKQSHILCFIGKEATSLEEGLRYLNSHPTQAALYIKTGLSQYEDEACNFLKKQTDLKILDAQRYFTQALESIENLKDKKTTTYLLLKHILNNENNSIQFASIKFD